MTTRLLLLSLLLLAAFAPARSLVELAPENAVAVLQLAPDAGPPSGLVDALAELGWPEAMDTLGRVAAVLGGDVARLAGNSNAIGIGAILDEFTSACPAAADALVDVEVSDLLAEGLLAVSVSPVAPIPHVVALARPGDPVRATALQDALVTCFGSFSLQQDGASIEVLFDAEDLPLIITRVDGVFVATTDPNLARAVVRRAQGAAEPSLADTALGQALIGLAPGGAGLGLDFGALGAVAAALGSAFPPEVAPLLERAVATLETLGVFAARVGWEVDGLRLEQIHAWPSPAPDPTLSDLLADPRRVDLPEWLPGGAVATSSTIVPLRGTIAYLDEWLAELDALLGMRMDVRGLADDLLWLDLDAALLSWVGETVHVIELAPIGTDLRSWVQGRGTIIAVPVLNEELAREGIDELAAGILRLLETIGSLTADPFASPYGDPFAPPSADPAFDALFGPEAVLVTREFVDGFEVDRVRAGPTFDMAVAFVDQHLVLATPFRAFGRLLETRDGGPELRADPRWRDVLDALPRDARNVRMVDASAHLYGLADIAELMAQPFASVLSVALAEEALAGFGADPFAAYGGFADDLTYPSFGSSLPRGVDLEELPAIALTLGSERQDTFTEGAHHLRYELVGVAPGMTVEVEMNDLAGGLDTYLFVFDGDVGTVYFENDDAPGMDRSFVAFVAEPDVRYHVLATSFSRSDIGTFRLAVHERGTVTAEAPEVTEPDAVEAPTFAELLQLTDLLPQALRLIAERSGVAVSTTTVEDDAAFTRMVLPLR